MANDVIVYDSIMGSNLPRAQKSAIRSWVENVGGSISSSRPQAASRFCSTHVITAAQVFRQNSETGVTAALLAALHVKGRKGLDGDMVAWDGAASIVNNVAAILLAKNEVSRDLLNVGSTCTAVYAFRKTYSLLSAMELRDGGSPGGTMGPTKAAEVAGEGTEDIDPLAKAAKDL